NFGVHQRQLLELQRRAFTAGLQGQQQGIECESRFTLAEVQVLQHELADVQAEWQGTYQVFDLLRLQGRRRFHRLSRRRQFQHRAMQPEAFDPGLARFAEKACRLPVEAAVLHTERERGTADMQLAELQTTPQRALQLRPA